MSKPDVDKLIAARELIARPDGWCTCDMAQDQSGRAVNALSHTAQRFCVYGALMRVCNDRHSIVLPLLDLIGEAAGVVDAIEFNNAQETAAPVIAAFDRAIELARAPT